MAPRNEEGMKNKKLELQDFLHKNDTDVICLQEAHLTEAPKILFTRNMSTLDKTEQTERKAVPSLW